MLNRLGHSFTSDGFISIQGATVIFLLTRTRMPCRTCVNTEDMEQIVLFIVVEKDVGTRRNLTPSDQQRRHFC